MGEMYSYLTCSDIVIMGGSFASLGGQNPIEALSLGKQVITGPSTHNFDEVVKQGSLAGVVHQVQNTKETITVANALLLDEHALGLKKKIAMGFTEKNAGALKKTMAYLISQRQSWREY
jgi:3-deoxy-D-manno-octulosonic-acid transferase